MSSTSIIIADAQYLIRLGLRHLIDSTAHLKILDEVENKNKLAQSLKTHQPDVVILDYNQPIHFGNNSVNEIKKISPNSKILVISADNDKQNIYNVLEQGVNSFLTKQCDEAEIIKAIDATAKGEKFFCNKVLNFLLHRSFGKEEEDCSANPLSPREKEIVTLVAKGKIAKEIASELNLSTHTIYTHRKNIMRKLKLGSTSELVLYAVKTGLIQSGQS